MIWLFKFLIKPKSIFSNISSAQIKSRADYCLSSQKCLKFFFQISLVASNKYLVYLLYFTLQWGEQTWQFSSACIKWSSWHKSHDWPVAPGWHTQFPTPARSPAPLHSPRPEHTRLFSPTKHGSHSGPNSNLELQHLRVLSTHIFLKKLNKWSSV